MKKSLLFIWAVQAALPGHPQVSPGFFRDAEIRLEPLRINTAASDISPAIVEGSFYFCSVREEYFRKKSRERKNKAYYEVFTAETDSKGRVLPGRKAINIQRRNFHEGPVAYCHSTREMFVTLSNTLQPDTCRLLIPAEEVRLRIAVKKYSRGSWTITEELPFTDRRYHYAHPAVSTTGDTLVFAGDLPGNLGKSDLYMTVRQGGKWSDPVNLGPTVNSRWDELFPTFGPGGTLFFSSDRPLNNLGKLDIFHVRFPGPDTVRNAGNKINSRFDDFGLVLGSAGDWGYFASNRPGRGSDDLFRIEINHTIQEIAGTVTDEAAGVPVGGATVRLLGCDRNELDAVLTGSNGEFLFRVRKNQGCYLAISKPGYYGATFRITPAEAHSLKIRMETRYHLFVMDRDRKSALPGALVIHNETTRLLTDAAGMAIPPVTDSLNRFRITAAGYLEQEFSVEGARLAGRHVTDTVWLVPKRAVPEEQPALAGPVVKKEPTNGLALKNGAAEAYYSVQIMASFKPAEISRLDFRGETGVFTMEVPPVTKYLIGKFDNYDEALSERKRLMAKFPDAFIIGILDGMVVTPQRLRRILR